MTKLKGFLEKYNLIFLLVFVFLTMQTYVFRSLTISTFGGVIYRSIVAILILVYLVLFVFCFKIKPSKLFIIISIAYIATSIISLIACPLIANVTVSIVQYLISISAIFINVISVYLFLYSYRINSTKIILFLVILISFVFLLCVYTYIFQYINIYESLTNKYGWNYDVTSIFYVKTVYGFFLTMGSVYSGILWFRIKKNALLFLPMFFLMNAIISRNKTSILLIFLISIILIVAMLQNLWKGRKKQFVVMLLILLFFVASGIVLIFTIPLLKRFLLDSIFKDGIVVLRARFEKWGIFFSNVTNPFNVFFGYGERIFITILSNDPVSDNIYINSFASGGLIKLIIHLCLATYLLKNKIHNKNYYSLIFVALFLISGAFEENYIFGFNVTSLVAAPLLYYSIEK